MAGRVNPDTQKPHTHVFLSHMVVIVYDIQTILAALHVTPQLAGKQCKNDPIVVDSTPLKI
jgi:hypothetical protein